MTAWSVVGGMADMVDDSIDGFAWGMARGTGQRLLGFWVLFTLYGGMEGLVKGRIMSRASVYRGMADWRRVFHMEVGDFAPEAAAALLQARVPAADRTGD